MHRIGRTGRAGETGYAISFVSPEAKAQLLDIEKLLGERIPTLDIDGYDATEAEKALASQFVPKATVGSGGVLALPAPQRRKRLRPQALAAIRTPPARIPCRRVCRRSRTPRA